MPASSSTTKTMSCCGLTWASGPLFEAVAAECATSPQTSIKAPSFPAARGNTKVSIDTFAQWMHPGSSGLMTWVYRLRLKRTPNEPFPREISHDPAHQDTGGSRCDHPVDRWCIRAEHRR